MPCVITFLIHMNTALGFGYERFTGVPVPEITFFSTDPLKFISYTVVVQATPSSLGLQKSVNKILLILIIDRHKVGFFGYTALLGFSPGCKFSSIEITVPFIIFPVLLALSICNICSEDSEPSLDKWA